MKKLLIVNILLFIICACSLRDTGLFTHTKGYFIKNENHWEEYRPYEKPGRWTTYSTYDEDGEYYYISNALCSLAVPKVSDHFLSWEQDGWKEIYDGRQIFSSFTDSGRDIYCHENGYFVRDGDNWKSYVEGKKGPVASFRTSSVDDGFFYIYNNDGYMMIPRVCPSGFYVSDDEENWKMSYYATDVYETGRSSLAYGSVGDGYMESDSAFVDVDFFDNEEEIDSMVVEPQTYRKEERVYENVRGRGKRSESVSDGKSSKMDLLCTEAGRYFEKEDYEHAFPLYKQAAELGHPLSMYRLGFMYEFGEGVSTDYEEALEWYRRSASKGFISAKEMKDIEEEIEVLRAGVDVDVLGGGIFDIIGAFCGF